MVNYVEYGWISERTIEPPIGDIPVGGLRVVNPVLVHER
jgi:hypothetical protein